MPPVAAATPVATRLVSVLSFREGSALSETEAGNPLASVFHFPDLHIRKANGAVKGLAANYPEPEATDGDGPGAFGCDSRETFETGAATWILLGLVTMLSLVCWWV